MSGHVGNLSPSQVRDLEQFKKSLSDVLNSNHDDHLLLQFLRARRFDLKKSEEMFRRHLQFREEFNEEYLLNEYVPPKILFKYFLPPLLGNDIGGSPIRVVKIGATDTKGILSCCRSSEILKFVTWYLDVDKQEMRRQYKETGVCVETRTFIFDMSGHSFKQIFHKDVLELMMSVLKLYEVNYPENLKVAFVVNAPSIFSWVFNIIKTVLADDTIQKVKIYGQSGWEKDILEYIDADILPVVYGGTKTDPNGDPRCPSLVFQGGPIPKEYYLRNQNRLSADNRDVYQVVVGRRSRHSVPIRVELLNSILSWEIDPQNCDIIFSLVFSEDHSPETIVKPTKISSDHGVEKGSHLAIKAGNYSLIFDNTYSIFRSKEILYKVFMSTFTADKPLSQLNGYNKT